MRFNHEPVVSRTHHRRHRTVHAVIALACLTPLLLLAGVVRLPLTPVHAAGQQGINLSKPVPGPEASRPLDPNQIQQLRQQREKEANFEAANTERKKQLTEDSAHLLALATELKTEVDKTNKDTLSLNVIRKASEIEKLAHDVREKMRLVVGQS